MYDDVRLMMVIERCNRPTVSAVKLQIVWLCLTPAIYIYSSYIYYMHGIYLLHVRKSLIVYKF